MHGCRMLQVGGPYKWVPHSKASDVRHIQNQQSGIKGVGPKACKESKGRAHLFLAGTLPYQSTSTQVLIAALNLTLNMSSIG